MTDTSKEAVERMAVALDGCGHDNRPSGKGPAQLTMAGADKIAATLRALMDEIARLKSDLETCRKYRNAYAEMDRIATEALRKCEAERDAARAETAMAFEAAAKFLDENALGKGYTKTPQGRTAIYYARKTRALTPTHATAALAARDKATREQALLEAAHVAQSFGPMDRDEILAIIDKETDHD